MLSRKNISKAEYIEWKKSGGSFEEDNEEIDEKIDEEIDEESEMNKIPNSFRLLTDDHFPLFVTYKKFSEMLQGTYGIDERKFTTQQRPDANDDGPHMQNVSWAHFVNYKLFKKKYWPHLIDCYRKKLDCELIYSEFSIIKVCNLIYRIFYFDIYIVFQKKKYISEGYKSEGYKS